MLIKVTQEALLLEVAGISVLTRNTPAAILPPHTFAAHDGAATGQGSPEFGFGPDATNRPSAGDSAIGNAVANRTGIVSIAYSDTGNGVASLEAPA